MNYIPYKYDNLMKENLIINFLLGKIQKYKKEKKWEKNTIH